MGARIGRGFVRLVLSMVAVGAVTFATVAVTGAVRAEAAVAVCDGNNHEDDAFSATAVFGGPLVGIRWIPAATQTITGVEIFTGRRPAPMALGIWSDQAGRPGAALSYTDYFTLSEEASWQGGPLRDPVEVLAGGTYWVVVDPPDGAWVSSAPSGITQPY